MYDIYLNLYSDGELYMLIVMAYSWNMKVQQTNYDQTVTIL